MNDTLPGMPFTDEDAIFFCRGEFSAPIIAAAAESLKARLEAEGVSGAARRRLFSTFVEMAQNVLHYAAEVPLPHGAPGKTGAIAITRTPAYYAIDCVNHVRSDFVPRLSAKLDALRQMSLEDIKRSYRMQLHNIDHADDDPISRGAGLGLLTIARDSTQPLEYAFSPCGDAHTPDVLLFRMRACI
ncbi:SiaB family protein kinase [Ramlibacter sp. H39-3-26]|uniref:SiaB family protein kinase n=1 Tax=Curvibacter soli TaxID=3031331 RepID=UPI0023D9F069|nr:SiaB family protein kinase [Ramlibacter sp. H39-3-26]MDF1484856.1 SiaB family protein kinase [Ramlibacter sp. H39-3-26]